MWWVASVGIVVFLAVTAVHLLRRRREIFDLPHGEMGEHPLTSLSTPCVHRYTIHYAVYSVSMVCVCVRVFYMCPHEGTRMGTKSSGVLHFYAYTDFLHVLQHTKVSSKCVMVD